MGGVPRISLPAKAPGEALFYSIDFTGDLGGATITSRNASIVAGAATAGGAGGAGGFVTALIGGGVGGGEIIALYQALTSDGQTLQCYVIIGVLLPPT